MAENDVATLDTTWKKIVQKIGDLVELRIETSISELEFKTVEGRQVLQPKAETAEGIVTKVRFLEGDITTHMSPAMLAADKAALMEAHTRHVAESREIIHTNIKAIADLVGELMKK
ncbi:MAG: hypothetical protein NTY94_04760 [Alphaproteobacteria bacterium]|jgi:hypothetical protein|nr:hypothetical protein [Alphaproteobacteria bacterium]